MSRGPFDAATQVAPGASGRTLRVRAARLTVVDGADRGADVHIDKPLYLVGTGTSADLRLSDETVSREHLRVALSPRGIRLRDEGSTNGTFLGGVRVRDVEVSSDVVLELGSTRLAVRLDAAALELPVSDSERFGAALGVSPAMRHLFAVLGRAAPSEVTVLLEGESGVGKEVLAHAIHAHSARREGPFVTVDCGAIPPNLIESELFGHERGAFTGADRSRLGSFEQANGGTIFLDELGELPLDMQPKLLRVLENREVRPVGGRGARHVDVRIVAATNRNLADASARNEFRRDLFYRLAVVRVTVPPLRDRPEDVLPLARAFLAKSNGGREVELPPDLGTMLLSYPWPGNVRELRNVIERYAVLGANPAALFDGAPTGSMAPRALASGEDLSHLAYHEARRVALDRFERVYLPGVLKRAGGVVSRAAQLAEVGRGSFHRMLHRIRNPAGGGEPDDA